MVSIKELLSNYTAITAEMQGGYKHEYYYVYTLSKQPSKFLDIASICNTTDIRNAQFRFDINFNFYTDTNRPFVKALKILLLEKHPEIKDLLKPADIFKAMAEVSHPYRAASFEETDLKEFLAGLGYDRTFQGYGNVKFKNDTDEVSLEEADATFQEVMRFYYEWLIEHVDQIADELQKLAGERESRKKEKVVAVSSSTAGYDVCIDYDQYSQSNLRATAIHVDSLDEISTERKQYSTKKGRLVWREPGVVTCVVSDADEDDDGSNLPIILVQHALKKLGIATVREGTKSNYELQKDGIIKILMIKVWNCDQVNGAESILCCYSSKENKWIPFLDVKKDVLNTLKEKGFTKTRWSIKKWS